jgi:hypothetical protein
MKAARRAAALSFFLPKTTPATRSDHGWTRLVPTTERFI